MPPRRLEEGTMIEGTVSYSKRKEKRLDERQEREAKRRELEILVEWSVIGTNEETDGETDD
ncbi:MAG: hypothetical protein Q9159_007537 [Coniocarpon cinnabarinum]